MQQQQQLLLYLLWLGNLMMVGRLVGVVCLQRGGPCWTEWRRRGSCHGPPGRTGRSLRSSARRPSSTPSSTPATSKKCKVRSSFFSLPSLRSFRLTSFFFSLFAVLVQSRARARSTWRPRAGWTASSPTSTTACASSHPSTRSSGTGTQFPHLRPKQSN